MSRLTDLKRGITLNPGVIRGGTRTNVIAGEAVVEVDLRIAHKADGPRMERQVKSLRPVNRNCQLHIEGGVNRPPLERTKAVAELFERAQQIGSELGLPAEGNRRRGRFGRQLHCWHRRAHTGWTGRGRRWRARFA